MPDDEVRPERFGWQKGQTTVKLPPKQAPPPPKPATKDDKPK